jgi:hypothetical protein
VVPGWQERERARAWTAQSDQRSDVGAVAPEAAKGRPRTVRKARHGCARSKRLTWLSIRVQSRPIARTHARIPPDTPRVTPAALVVLLPRSFGCSPRLGGIYGGGPAHRPDKRQ